MVDHSLSLHSLWCSVVLQPVQSFLGAYVVKWSQVLFLTVRLSCHFERPPFGFVAKQLSALSIWFVHRFHNCSFLCWLAHLTTGDKERERDQRQRIEMRDERREMRDER